MTPNPTKTIETGLTLHTLHEAVDRLPDEITLRFVRASPTVIALRASRDGTDRAHARVVYDVGTGSVTFELESIGDGRPLAVDLFERVLREIAR